MEAEGKACHELLTLGKTEQISSLCVISLNFVENKNLSIVETLRKSILLVKYIQDSFNVLLIKLGSQILSFLLDILKSESHSCYDSFIKYI